MVAVALLALGVGGGDSTTTTVLDQTPLSGTTTLGEDGLGAVPSARDIYARDAPGVVYVRAGGDAVARIASPFGGGQADPQPGESSGTGFVLDAAGHILTNHHVVGNAREVSVEFSDERTVRAQVLGDDSTNDLALLRVDPTQADLHPLTLGDSGSARVGDPVLAIGNPFGLGRTLTTGVVSALQRQLKGPNGLTIQNVIQTDAPIGPGNAGGPLLDAGGRVIGITARMEGNGNGGIGFAIPVDTAKELLPELKRTGSVAHPYVGITGLTIDPVIAEQEVGTKQGVLVQTVYAGSPAARAGLHGGSVESQINGNRIQLGGDVITALDGRTLTSMEELTSAMAERKPGDRVELGILRERKAMRLVVRLGTAPKTQPTEAQAHTP